jgi:hypothetical protein
MMTPYLLDRVNPAEIHLSPFLLFYFSSSFNFRPAAAAAMVDKRRRMKFHTSTTTDEKKKIRIQVRSTTRSVSGHDPMPLTARDQLNVKPRIYNFRLFF